MPRTASGLSGRSLHALRRALLLLACAFLAACSTSRTAPVRNQDSGLPQLDLLDGLADARRGSLAGLHVPPGRFVATSNGAVMADADTLYLPRDAGLPPEYAVYAVDGLTLQRMVTAVELHFANDDYGGLWCAVANFARNRWEVQHAVRSGTGWPLPLTAPPADYLSPAGSFYFAVLAWPGHVYYTGADLAVADSSPLPTPSGFAVTTATDGLELSWDAYTDLRADGLMLTLTGEGINAAYVLRTDQTSYHAADVPFGVPITCKLRARRSANGLSSASAAATAYSGYAKGWAGLFAIYSSSGLPDGGMIFTGPGSPGSDTSCVVRLTPAGKVAASRCFSQIRIKAVATDGSAVYLAGGPTASSYKPLLIKTDLDFNVAWANTYMKEYLPGSASKIAIDSLGNIALACTDSGGGPDGGYSRATVLKILQDGSFFWGRRLANGDSARLEDLASDEAGVVACGYNGGPYILNIGEMGGLRWERVWRSTAPDTVGLESIVRLPDGSFCCGGYLVNSQMSGLLMQLDPYSGFMQARVTEGSARFEALALDSRDGIWVTGQTKGYPEGGLLMHWDQDLSIDWSAQLRLATGDSLAPDFNAVGLGPGRVWLSGEAFLGGALWEQGDYGSSPIVLHSSLPVVEGLVSLSGSVEPLEIVSAEPTITTAPDAKPVTVGVALPTMS